MECSFGESIFGLLQRDPITDKPLRKEVTQGMLLNSQCLEHRGRARPCGCRHRAWGLELQA